MESSNGFISGVLNFLSENSFGRPRENSGWLANAYRALTSRPPGQRSRGTQEAALIAREAAVQEEVAGGAGQELPSILLISPASIAKIATRYPKILSMSSDELAMRLVGLKVLLPGCDVALMIERVPTPFLSQPREEVEHTVAAAARVLREGMAGADVERMLESDPGLLFVDVVRGVEQLRELWDEESVDEQALRNSDPTMLALAVRTLAL